MQEAFSAGVALLMSFARSAMAGCKGGRHPGKDARRTRKVAGLKVQDHASPRFLAGASVIQGKIDMGSESASISR